MKRDPVLSDRTSFGSFLNQSAGYQLSSAKYLIVRTIWLT